jgi:hypothetical protein
MGDRLEDLLTLPANVEDRQGAWQKLTSGAVLFDALAAAVRTRAADWARLRDLVRAWRDEFVAFEPGGDAGRDHRRWQIVSRLVASAAEAADDPLPPAGASAETPPDETYCGWVDTFRGAVVRGGPVRVAVALLDEQQRAGFLMELHLEVVEGGPGGAFHHPGDALATDLDVEFHTSLRHAWSAASRLARQSDPSLPNGSGRFRVRRPGWPLSEVCGPSASAAAARGWWHALLGKVPDEGVVVMARVVEDGGEYPLGEVEGIAEKARAVAASESFDTVVVAGPANRAEAERVLQELPGPERIRVIDLTSA